MNLVGIDQLGFEPGQKAAFLSAIRKLYGMILVTGPTGSGKTVSLYSALDLLRDRLKRQSLRTCSRSS